MQRQNPQEINCGFQWRDWMDRDSCACMGSSKCVTLLSADLYHKPSSRSSRSYNKSTPLRVLAQTRWSRRIYQPQSTTRKNFKVWALYCTQKTDKFQLNKSVGLRVIVMENQRYLDFLNKKMQGERIKRKMVWVVFLSGNFTRWLDALLFWFNM